jgi:hypothetical protein
MGKNVWNKKEKEKEKVFFTLSNKEEIKKI